LHFIRKQDTKKERQKSMMEY